MTTIVTRAAKGSALTWVEADANFQNLNSAKLENIAEDLSPQLGANLDVNGFSIVSVSNGDINITPNGTGIVSIDSVKVGNGKNSISTNIAVGNTALNAITTGANNVGVGTNSIRDTSNGAQNTAVGNNTFVRNNSGSNNTAIGYNALNYTVGTGNTVIGHNAGSAIDSGSYNVILGNNTGSSIINSSNNILISDGQGNIRISIPSTGNATINGQVTANRFNINTTDNTGSTAIGQIAWNDGEGCLEYLLKGGNVNLQIGQETVLQITNNTGSTLSDGQLVYISGSSGQLPTVTLANANSEATSSKTIGMVTESILNGSNGFITTNGIVHGLDTIAYTAGTGLWLSTIDGTYSSTKPSSPNHGVFIGWVVRSHATSGSIYVHIQNGYELNELHDVSINSLSDGQLLKYNSTSTVWENWTPNYLTSSDIGSTVQAYDSDLTAWSSVSTTAKQDTLVSGTNLKTVNGNDLLGAGNIVISAGNGIGSIVAYKADGSQDNIDVTANTVMDQVRINQELLMDASALFALENTASYGWRDNIASFVVKATSGTSNPSWGTLWSGMEGLIFSASAMNQVWVDFHIDHDYALGTSLYPHIHWVPTTTGTGVVRFGVEYSVAKGHQQGASSTFPASTTVYVEQTISTASQWQHFVAEVSDINAIPSTNVEPDTVIKVRIFRDAAHPNDTYAGTIHAWQCDLHYRANRFATLNKAPNFNGA